MVNLDMVGALRDDKLMVFGTDSAPSGSGRRRRERRPRS